MQTIQEQHAQAVYEAHILALKTLTNLLQRETDPVEQRRISAIILRTKPTPPKPAEQPPSPPSPPSPRARPSKPLLPALPKLPPLNADPDLDRDDDDDLDPADDLDAEDDDALDVKPFSPRDLETLRQLMAVTTTSHTAEASGNHGPSS